MSGGAIPNYARQALSLFSEYGSADAIVDGDRRLSFTDVVAGVQRYMAILAAQGIRAGDTVAVLAHNQPEALFLQFALHLLGCRSAWVATAIYDYQADLVRRAGIQTLIYATSSHGEVGAKLAGQFALESVYCLGPGGVGPDLLTITPAGASPDLDTMVPEPESVFQSSGSTGQPKLIRHGHRFFRALLRLAGEWRQEGRPALRHLQTQGYWHPASHMAAMIVLYTGGTLVLADKLSTSQVLAQVERERITSLIVAPPGLYQLLDEPMSRTADLSSLAMITCGGSAASPSRLSEAATRLGPLVRVVYALAEAPAICELPGAAPDPEHPERLRSCGKPYGGMRVEIRDAAGSVLPPGKQGEIWVAGDLVTTGYWGEPDRTGRVLADGWLRTLDCGYLDADGYLYIMGRLSEAILTGVASWNVYPGPIENVLTAHPAVRAAAVVGVPDEAMGEAPIAFVVLKPGATATADELRTTVMAQLDHPAWAPREIEVTDSLPVIGFGKVDKAALRSAYLRSRAAT